MTNDEPGDVVLMLSPDIAVDLDNLGALLPTNNQDYCSYTDLRRDVYEALLLISLLKMAEPNIKFSIRNTDSVARQLAMLKQGKVDVSGAMLPTRGFEGDDWLHMPLSGVSNQSVSAVFYAKPELAEEFGALDKEEFRKLMVISSQSWKPDWLALEAAGFTRLISVPEWALMTRMVHSGRADIFLGPSQAGNTNLVTSYGELARVKGFGIRLTPNRAWWFSPESENGRRLFEALRYPAIARAAASHCLAKRLRDVIVAPADEADTIWLN